MPCNNGTVIIGLKNILLKTTGRVLYVLLVNVKIKVPALRTTCLAVTSSLTVSLHLYNLLSKSVFSTRRICFRPDTPQCFRLTFIEKKMIGTPELDQNKYWYMDYTIRILLVYIIVQYPPEKILVVTCEIKNIGTQR